jgi:phage protein D
MTTEIHSPKVQDGASPFVILGARKRTKDDDRQVYPERILRVNFKDTSRKSANRLKIVLDNGDGLLFGDDLLMRKGTLIHFRFGYPSSHRDAGDFVLKKRKPSGLNLELECHEAKRNKHSRKPNTRQWPDAKRSDVARHMLGRMGFSGSQLHVDESDLVLPLITQYNQGDYQFLENLADEEGKEFWFDDAGAHWEEPKRGEKPSRKYKYKKGLIGVGNVIGDPIIEDFGAHAPGRIRARGIDPITGEEYVVTASDSTNPDEAVKGLIKLAETDGMMTPEEGDENASGNEGFEIEEFIAARTKAEAKVAVDTLYKKYRYAGLKVKIPLNGDPFIFPRTINEVWGLGPAVDGYFWVKEVNHELQPGSAFKTTVELNKDGLNRKRGGKIQVPAGQESTYWRDNIHAVPLTLTAGGRGVLG